MSDLRNTTELELFLLKINYYPHIELLGYYKILDLPTSMKYIIDNSKKQDNKGTIIKVQNDFLFCNTQECFPEFFGAVGDGVTSDVVPILLMSNYCRDNKINKISFLNKEYSIGRVPEEYKNLFVNKILIFMYSNLILNGNNAIIKLQDNYFDNVKDNIKLIYSIKDTKDVYIKNITLDFNGENNFFKGEHQEFIIAVGCLDNSNNISLDTITVIDHPGRQTFLFGNNGTNTWSRNVLIQNCKINNVGNGVKGNDRQTDHSIIYIHGEKSRILNNIFINHIDFEEYNTTSTATAIELHSNNSVVSGNIITNFSTAIIIAAATKDHIGTKINNNIGLKVDRFVDFWSDGENKIDNITISNNRIEEYYKNFPVLSINQNLKGGQNGKVIISNNTIKYVGVYNDLKCFPAIYIQKFSDIIINSNIIEKTKMCAIQIFGNKEYEVNVSIKDNQFKDCCYNTNTDYFIADKTMLFNNYNFNILNIQNNIFNYNTSVSNAKITLYIDSPTNQITLTNNSYIYSNDIKDRRDIAMNNISEDNYIYIHEICHTVIRNTINANIGSIIIDPTTNLRWDKIKSNKSGWVYTKIGLKSPQEEEDWTLPSIAGDKVTNGLPIGSSPYYGWVCYGNGTPGLWRPISLMGITPKIDKINIANATDLESVITLCNKLKETLNTKIDNEKEVGQQFK